MSAILIEIKNNSPYFFETGKTVADLKRKLDVDGKDCDGLISAIEQCDLSGIGCKFEIKPNFWLLIN